MNKDELYIHLPIIVVVFTLLLFMMIASTIAFMKECLAVIPQYYIHIVLCYMGIVAIFLFFFAVITKLTYDYLLTKQELENELVNNDNSKSRRL